MEPNNSNDFLQLFNIFTIKIGTFFAGLFGATITLMKRGEGSILSRLGGYFSAIIAIIYVVPFIVELIRYAFSYQMPDVGEHILAFSFGLLANNIIENFLNDPSGSVRNWIKGLRNFKTLLANSPLGDISINPDKHKTDDASSVEIDDVKIGNVEIDDINTNQEVEDGQ